MSAGIEAGRFGSGQVVRRVEDPALVAGRGRYTDDLAPAGETHLVFVRSTHAHARIVSIDCSAARAMPGVLAVYTGAQLADAGVKPIPFALPFKRPDGKPMASAPRRALAHETVRFVGEAVAAIVAETREAARAAAEAVIVDYDELPAVVDAFAAMQPGAPVLCADAPDNIAAEARHGDVAATTRAFERAAHVVSLDLANQRVCPVTMEPRTVLAELDQTRGRLVVNISNQMPTAVRDTLADAIPGMTQDSVRVLVGDVGGGFGMKGGAYPEDIAIGYAALQVKRPVKWRAERVEEFLSATHGRDATSRAEMALDADGKALALRIRTLANVGAYATTVNVIIPLLVGPWVTTSIYDIGAIDLHATAVMTNTAPVGAYRGAGRPEAIYIVERLMDAAARLLKLDPAELRRRNMIRPEQMPYTNPMAQTYDSGHFERILDQGLELADWNGFAERRAASERARQAARSRHCDVSRMDQRRGLRRTRDRRRARRRHHRARIGRARHGPGHRHQPRATGGRRLSGADRAHPRIDRRHRSRQRLRQRRFAIAVHRRVRGAGGIDEGRRPGQAARRRTRSKRRSPTSSTAPGATA